jgi:hypothetical protein
MEQLRMSRYSLLRDGTVVEEKMPPFTVMLNPSELKRGFSRSVRFAVRPRTGS